MSDAYDHPGRSRRHPSSGGYASGRRTRARIIAAALHVFGEYGYDAASTRRIAEHAGINTPAIQYYFGGKRGLHAACTRHVIGRVSSLLALPLRHARDALSTAEPPAALDMLCELLAAVVDGLVVAGSENWRRYLACVTGDAGLFDTLAQLIAAATGESPDGNLTRLRACMLLGQVSSLYDNHAHTLAELGWSHFDEHALALIKWLVREHTRGALATSVSSVTQPGCRHRGPSWAQPGG
jgi:AcrR family transcriptional regulator